MLISSSICVRRSIDGAVVVVVVVECGSSALIFSGW